MITHIVAMDVKGGIGLNNKLPWHYPEDLKHFSQLTSKKDNLYVGYNTYLSLLEYSEGREELLTGRIVNVVVTKDLPNSTPIKDGVTFIDKSLLDIIVKDSDAHIIIIGGASLYKAYHPGAVFVTTVNKEFNCDTFYPTEYLDNFISKFKIKTSETEDLEYSLYM